MKPNILKINHKTKCDRIGTGIYTVIGLRKIGTIDEEVNLKCPINGETYWVYSYHCYSDVEMRLRNSFADSSVKKNIINNILNKPRKK
jgi:hypothetical protein